MRILYSRRCGGKGQSLRGMLLLLLAVILGLSACGGTVATSTTSAQPQGPVVIGVSLSLTGDQASDGQATQKGYEVWVDYMNHHGGLLGHQVQLIVLDDNSNVDQTTTNYEKLIAVDHVNFVVGPFNDPQTVAGARVASRHGYAFLEGIGTSPSTFQQGLPNLFAVSLSATHYLQSFVHYILSLPVGERPQTIAYASSNDSFTQPQIDQARALFEQGGIRTAYYSIFPAQNTDLSLVGQKVVNSRADVVLLGTVGLDDCAPFLKTFIQQHYNPKAIIATAGPDQGSTFTSAIGGTKNAGGILVPNDGWWPDIKTFQNASFQQAYTAKYGGTPDDISSDSVQAFSVGQVLAQALNQTKSLDNQQLIRALQTGTFQSLQGPVKFDSTGQNDAATAVLFQWQKGNLIPVYPQGDAQASILYPKPSWP